MPTLKGPSRDPFNGDHLGKLRRLKEAGAALGIELPSFGRADELAAHSRELSRLRSANREGRSQRVREVGSALGRQEISTEVALQRAVEIEVETSPDGMWADILKQGAHSAVLAGFEALTDPTETLITDTIRPMAEDVIAEVARLRKLIPPSVSDAAAASLAGEKTAASWSRYEALVERWNALHGFVAQLRLQGVLPHADGTSDLRAGIEPGRWRYLLVREDWLRLDPRPRVRILLDAECDEWGPGLYTAVEIEANIAEARRQAREEERGAVGSAVR
jgi:hypothetical protein